MICRYKLVQSNLCYCCHPFVLCVYIGSHEQQHDQVEEWEHGMHDIVVVHNQVENELPPRSIVLIVIIVILEHKTHLRMEVAK
jgi:hypothetical protein